jgi:hypothetical protein
MDCSHLATRSRITRFMMVGLLAVLPVTRAHAQTATKVTMPPTVFEPASLMSPAPLVTITERSDADATRGLVSTSGVSGRGALSREAIRESARPIPVEPNRSRARVGQSGSQGSQQKGWVGRHPVLFGALLGVGPGILFGEVVLGQGADFPHGPDMLIGAGIGAGIGALIGLAIR